MDLIRSLVMGFTGFLLVISIGSCTEMEIEEPMVVDFVDIGSYSLLEESIDKMPYLDKEEIVFVDSFQNHVSFKITENLLFKGAGATLIKYDVFEEGDTVRYRYTSEIKSFRIQNDSLDMLFLMSLQSRPYYADPESEFVADVLNIYCNNPDPNITSSQVFYHETDTRTWPSTFNSEAKDEREILDRTFKEVYNNGFIEPISVVNFNYEFGIVSFTDMEGKLWRFEELK